MENEEKADYMCRAHLFDSIRYHIHILWRSMTISISKDSFFHSPIGCHLKLK